MKKLISVFLSLMLVLALPVQVLAAEYDLTKGDVTVTVTDTGQHVHQLNNTETPPPLGNPDTAPVITSYGVATDNTVIITQYNTSNGATVILKDVNISTEDSDEVGVLVGGINHEIKLKGTNTITCSGENSADIVVQGDLTISGDSGASLTAKNISDSGGTVTITGGTVNDVQYPLPEPEPEPEPEPAPAPAVWAEKVKAPEPSYWDSLIWKLSQMEDDITLTLDLGTYTWIPRTLIQTARGKNITLILQWNGGEDITILPTDTIDMSLWSIQLKDLA